MTKLTIALFTAATLAASITGCFASTAPAPSSQAPGSAQLAHHAYTTVINANDLEGFLAMLTEDAVFLPPNGPRVVGKPAVREWATPYLEAYTVHWDKTILEFIVTGDWAFEQYAYVEHDLAKDGSHTLDDTGKGLIVWRRDHDGAWRVARDIWCSDLPAN